MTPQIADQIQAEQDHGREKYGRGNPNHDDAHSLEEWVHFARDHAERAKSNTPQESRQHLIKAAGLLVSAIESFDRNGGWRRM